MQAIFNGTVLADSDDIVMVDGNPYFPRAAMAEDFSGRPITPPSADGRARLAIGMWWSAIR